MGLLSLRSGFESQYARHCNYRELMLSFFRGKMKERNFLIDNSKVLLIFLVIFGHVLEVFNKTELEWLYKGIYIIHMPFFAFISGFLYKKKGKDFFIKNLKIYLLFQALYIFVDVLLFDEGLYHVLWYLVTPKYIMWYLFSFMSWVYISNKIQEVKLEYIGAAILISLAAGFVILVNRPLSLSRTIYFLPYFLAGRMVKEKTFTFEYRKIAISVFSIMTFLIIYIDFDMYLLWGASHYNSPIDLIYRVILYIAGFSGIFSILSIMPNYKIGNLKISSNTLSIYILHGFVMRVLLYLNIQINVFWVLFVAFFISLVLINLLWRVKLGTPKN